MYKRHSKNTQLSRMFLFLPKSTPDGDVYNVRHAALAGPPLMVSTCTPLWPWFSLRTAPCPRHLCLLIFLCVPPAAFSLARRKVKDARGKKRSLFCSSNMQAQLDSKTNYRALGKIAQLFVCFVRLLLFCF